MRGLSILLLVFACDEPAAGSAWTEVEVAEAAGVTFQDVSVIGDLAIAVGARDAGRGAALVIEGESWTAIDTADLPPLDHVFAAAADDVWVEALGDDEEGSGGLWRWDGTDWAPVELPAAIVDIRDVWGTGPDDVWIAAQFDGPVAEQAGAYHWDGSLLTEHRDFFEMLGVVDDGSRILSMGGGCSRTPDDVWLAGGLSLDGFGNAAGNGFHFDGEVWRVRDMFGMPRELVCLETEMWYLGEADIDGPFLGVWQGDQWVLQDGLPGARVGSLGAAAGSLWMVGDEPQGASAASLQVWRLVDGALVPTIDESEVRETPNRPLLRALYETPAGTVRALGVDGLVLDHTGG